jgi:RES domain-containing protein
MLYSSASVGLAALEKFVHLPSAPWPPLVLVAIDIPDSCTIYRPALEELPVGWDVMPSAGVSQAFGAAWVDSGASLGMEAPSILVPEEFNVLLNPSHADYAKVEMSVVRPFNFNERMMKKGWVLS